MGPLLSKVGGTGVAGVGLAEISMGHPCLNFGIIPKILGLHVTISDVVRSIRMLNFWGMRTGWVLSN